MYGFYKTTLVASLVAACSVLLTSAITAEPRSTPQNGPDNSIVLPTSSKGILSQCGDYFTFNPESLYYGVIPKGYEKKAGIPIQHMSVPVYGFMSGVTFDAIKATKLKQGQNPYTPLEINQALWEGHSFIWTDKMLPAETFNFVKSYADNWNKTHEKKVIVLSWNPEWKRVEKVQNPIPQGRQFAFSHWNISQSCISFSEAAFSEFMQHADAQDALRDSKVLPIAKLVDGKLPEEPPA